jgi:hypothetical protein
MIAGRRLRAPGNDGAVFAEPPLVEMRRLLAQAPWQRKPPRDLQLCGRSLLELRSLGRETALQAAQSYLALAGLPLNVTPSSPILAAGHQPEMFHPGVWVKNFALHGLATAAAMAPLNLVVDNDTVKTTSLKLPAWQTPSEPDTFRIASIHFDAWPGEMPYEECAVRDEEDFRTLPQRTAEVTRQWDFKPLLGNYWAEVLRHVERTPLLGERLVAGRRALERAWGCSNLEVPVSKLCESEPFAWFVAHFFSDLDRFHAAYNQTVQDYRRVHGLRSRNHPVPDLAADDDWREVPLWAWRAASRRRGRLFVRATAEAYELRVEGEDWPPLPRPAQALVKAWNKLHLDGFKIRSRALTTTLFTRLFVAEAFIHGIGGGKYDELTDELIRRFYGLEPPPFMVLSATLLLPFAGFPATVQQRRNLAHSLRDVRWNPQRHLQAPLVDSPAAALGAEKQAIVASLADHPDVGIFRHQALRRLTENLRPFVEPALRDKQNALHRLDAELRANAILKRRDYPFCLYPEALLRPFCEQFLA